MYWLLVPVFVAGLGEGTAPKGFPARPGPLVLCRAKDLAADAHRRTIEWLARFELVLTNGYELPSPPVVRRLRAAGCRVFGYFWANGFTALEATAFTMPDGDWRRDVACNHPEWLICEAPLPGPPGTGEAYYCDFAQPAAVHFLAERVAQLRRAGRYDGIFFDYAGEYALPDSVRQKWAQKHPGLSYDEALARFFAALRHLDPRGLIFTNGACLGAPELRRAVDYDLVESYGTSYAWGPAARLGDETFPLTFRRPWHGPAGLRETFGALVERLAAGRPRRDQFCLDYMRPVKVYRDGQWHEETDVEAVYYSYCAAALWGLKSYCSGWYGVEYRGPLYFVDLGRPLGDGPVEKDSAVVREYQRGLVVLMTTAQPVVIEWQLQRPYQGYLYDLCRSRKVAVSRRGKATLRLQPNWPAGAPGPMPVGRVFLKVSANGSES